MNEEVIIDEPEIINEPESVDEPEIIEEPQEEKVVIPAESGKPSNKPVSETPQEGGEGEIEYTKGRTVGINELEKGKPYFLGTTGEVVIFDHRTTTPKGKYFTDKDGTLSIVTKLS